MNPLVFAIKHSFLEVRRNLDEGLSAYGLSTPQLEILLLLADGETEQRTLQDDVATRSASLTTLLGRMQERGLIGRRPDPGDGRRSLVSITAEGRSLLDELTEEIEPTFIRQLEADISAEDLATTTRVLNQIIRNMGVDAAETASND